MLVTPSTLKLKRDREQWKKDKVLPVIMDYEFTLKTAEELARRGLPVVMIDQDDAYKNILILLKTGGVSIYCERPHYTPETEEYWGNYFDIMLVNPDGTLVEDFEEERIIEIYSLEQRLRSFVRETAVY